MLKTILSTSEQMTQRLGNRLGACLRTGDVVLLQGEMGAGKSVLCRAIARGMGVEGSVPSPTFTIMNVHEGTALKLYHFDLYRLSDAEELWAMGLDEYIGADGITLIEWPQNAWDAMPEKCLFIQMNYGEDLSQRVIELSSQGGFEFEQIVEALKEEIR